jgi:hypothetical protein
MTLGSSIFADNTASSAPDLSGESGSLGTNLVQHDGGCLSLLETDIVGVDPRLLPLADNGGATPTHALGLYSKAVDAVSENCDSPIDQRGIPRPLPGLVGGHALCDLGAVEVPSQPPPCPADLDDGSSTHYPDGGVDIGDLIYFLAQFENGAAPADLDDGSSTGTPNGGVDINDLLFFILHFEVGC